MRIFLIAERYYDEVNHQRHAVISLMKKIEPQSDLSTKLAFTLHLQILLALGNYHLKGRSD